MIKTIISITFQIIYYSSSHKWTPLIHILYDLHLLILRHILFSEYFPIYVYGNYR